MNWEHFKAIAWLRWRLSRNQWKRAGFVNGILMAILTVGVLLLAGVSFFLALVMGVILLPQGSPIQVMYVWDGIVGLYMLGWTISLLAEIQRSEMLSLDKFLHLPMSLRTAFALNYLTTFFSLSVICIAPGAIGLSLASVYSYGPHMLILIPLVIAFFFMMTAFKYQIQGRVASLISNKRRQRSIVVAITFVFVLVSQLPNVVIQYSIRVSAKEEQAKRAELNQLQADIMKQDLRPDAKRRVFQVVKEKFDTRRKENSSTALAWCAKHAVLANKLIPVGWLPTGATQLADGIIWPAGLCLLGLTSIGSFSLWRAYSSTVKAYTRQASVQTAQPIKESDAATGKRKIRLIERQLPWVSESTSAVAIGSLISFARAPESKMLLITPFIFGSMFVVSIWTQKIPRITPEYAPLVMQAAVGLLAFLYTLLTNNVFGLDRNGFRFYVLMPVGRREILLGKNLAAVPIFLVLLSFVFFTAIYFGTTNIFHCIGGLLQAAIVFLLVSSLGNQISILFPFAMPVAGSGKPLQVNFKSVAAQMAATFLCPLIVVPGLLAIGIEILMHEYFHITFFPIYLVFSAIELAIVRWLYLKLIEHQATLLQRREPDILALLASNIE